MKGKAIDNELLKAIKILESMLIDVNAVVCARSSPKQKARLVRMVKNRGKIVLAVGDGANDEASVGVGIFGEEGLQAVQVSDYAISSFKYLWKLVLVQGRWNNLRIAKFINFYLYKNFIFTFPQFLFGFINLFSGNPMYDGNWASVYNLFFTSFPICYLAVFDKDITYEHIMSTKEEEEHYKVSPLTSSGEDISYIPTKTLKVHRLIKKNFHYLYYISQKGLPFGWHTFLWQVINSLFMSLILCLVGYEVYDGTTILHIKGYPADFWMASFGIYTALVFATVVAVIVRASQITWVFILIFIVGLSLGPFYFLTYLYDIHLTTKTSLKEFVIFNLSVTYNFYLFFVFFMLVVFSVEIGSVYVRLLFKPTLADYFKWLIKNGKADQKEYFTPTILENFIRLHDPIPKKVEIDWTDIFSSKASQPITKPEDQSDNHEQSETPDVDQTNKNLKKEDRNDISVLSGAEDSSNQGTVYGNVTIDKQSIRSLESKQVPVKEPVKNLTKTKDLFVIEDHPVDGQEEDESVYSIYSLNKPDDKSVNPENQEDEILDMPHLRDSFCEEFSEIRDEESSIIDH